MLRLVRVIRTPCYWRSGARYWRSGARLASEVNFRPSFDHAQGQQSGAARSALPFVISTDADNPDDLISRPTMSPRSGSCHARSRPRPLTYAVIIAPYRVPHGTRGNRSPYLTAIACRCPHCRRWHVVSLGHREATEFTLKMTAASERAA